MLKRAISLALEGGGAKGFLYTGALKALQNRAADLHIKNVAGSSAGALTAMLIAMNVPYQDMQDIVTGTSPLGSIQDIQDEIAIEKRQADFSKHYAIIDKVVSDKADEQLSFLKEMAFDWYIWPHFEDFMEKVGGKLG